MSFAPIRELEKQIEQDAKRESIRENLKRWENNLLTCVGHLTRMWKRRPPPAVLAEKYRRMRQMAASSKLLESLFGKLSLDAPQHAAEAARREATHQPDILVLEEEELSARQYWLEQHKELVQALICLSPQTEASLKSPVPLPPPLYPQKASSSSRSATAASVMAAVAVPVGAVALSSGASAKSANFSASSSTMMSTPLLKTPSWAASVEMSSSGSSDAMDSQPSTSSRQGPSKRSLPDPTPAVSLQSIEIAMPAFSSNSSSLASSSSAVRGPKLSQSASEIMFALISHLVLCRSNSVWSDARTDQVALHKSLLGTLPLLHHPSLAETPPLSQSKASETGSKKPEPPNPSAWVHLSDFESLAWPVLRRLRLWSLQHSRARRRGSTWPSRQELNDIETVCAALVVFRLPAVFSKRHSASTIKGQALVWHSDEKSLDEVFRWTTETLPPVGDKAVGSSDTTTPVVRALLPSEWVPHLAQRQAIMPYVMQGPFQVGSATVLPAIPVMTVATAVVKASDVVPRSARVVESEQEAKRREEEEEAKKMVVTGSSEESDSESGRVWDPKLSVAHYLSEVESIMHGLLIQEYFSLVFGIVLPRELKPIIHSGMREALVRMLTARARLESGDDKWKTEFRLSVFEHLLPVGARAIALRGTGAKNTGTGGAGANLLDAARANAQPMVVMQRDLGFKTTEVVDRLLDQSSKMQMTQADHEFHDLFVLNLFSFVFTNATTGELRGKPEGMPLSVDFLGLYYLPPHDLEKRGRDLLTTRRRYGMPRRPIVVWLCRRWMVHDFVEEKSASALDSMREALAGSAEAYGALADMSTIGVWFDCGDSVQDALLTWIYLVKTRYDSAVEDGTPIWKLCKEAGMADEDDDASDSDADV
jgi:hypothetical protein